MFKLDFFGTGRARLIIQARPTQTEQFGLLAERKLTLASLNEADAFLPRQSCNFFLSQPTCVLNLPISAYSSLSCCSWAFFSSAVLSCFSKSPGSPSNAIARQFAELRRMDFILCSNLGQRLLFFEEFLRNACFERGCILFSHRAFSISYFRPLPCLNS